MLQIGPDVLYRLALIASGGVINNMSELKAWPDGEYTERDNLVFRLYKALTPHLPNMSDVFTVVYSMQNDFDQLVTLARAPAASAGVVVIADSRYVKWPGYAGWFDLWDVRRPKTGSDIEPSLRVTTAIHLHAVLQPLT